MRPDFQPKRLRKALKAVSKGAKWIKFLLGRELHNRLFCANTVSASENSHSGKTFKLCLCLT